MGKISLYIILLFTIISCNNEQSLSKELLLLQSRPVILPLNEDLIIRNVDSILMNGKKDELKYIIYSDSLDCTSCMINNLSSWNPILEYSKKYNGKLIFQFIFSPIKKDLRQINMLIEHSGFKHQIMIDLKKNFEKLNPHLPKNKALHSFLLDENNNVILVGNPLHNKKIEEMFYKIVEERLGKPQQVSTNNDN